MSKYLVDLSAHKILNLFISNKIFLYTYDTNIKMRVHNFQNGVKPTKKKNQTPFQFSTLINFCATHTHTHACIHGDPISGKSTKKYLKLLNRFSYAICIYLQLHAYGIRTGFHFVWISHISSAMPHTRCKPQIFLFYFNKLQFLLCNININMKLPLN